ncbi:MAG TPA: hypothetical protein DEQ84_06650 [Prevotellaceae bacterium]|nr:hypothetical protein [Prevotellaceae bacterium]
MLICDGFSLIRLESLLFLKQLNNNIFRKQVHNQRDRTTAIVVAFCKTSASRILLRDIPDTIEGLLG